VVVVGAASSIVVVSVDQAEVVGAAEGMARPPSMEAVVVEAILVSVKIQYPV